MSSGGHRRTLAGRYRLGEVLGRGGMSTVYRARDMSLDRLVAVKVAMDPLLESDPIYAARFKREARAAAALSHPGVVTVFDAGADGPTRYIVMEYVEGLSLAQVLREERPLEPARAAGIAEQIADTLSAAHAAGIVHRDIKPGNVMIVEGGVAGRSGDTPNETVKVLDFGIARTPDAVTLTQTASVLGTAPYMAPEQAMGNPADARSDIYSLGCVLYEMLTGQPPFMADVPAAVLHQHVRVPLKPPRALNPALPPALDTLVVQMLAKKPEDRQQTAAEVRDRLAAYETEAQTEPTVPLTAAATAATEVLVAAAAAAAEVPQIATVSQPASPAAAEMPATRAVPPPRKQGSGPWAFLAVVALLLLGAAVAYALVSGGGSGQTSSSSSHSSATGSPPATARSTASPHSTSAPSSSSSSSSSSTTPTTPTSTSTTTTTTTTTTTASTPTGPPAPPGQGGTPPGQAKKGKPK